MIAKHRGLHGRIRLIVRRYKQRAATFKNNVDSIWSCHDDVEMPPPDDVHHVDVSEHELYDLYGPVGLLIEGLT